MGKASPRYLVAVAAVLLLCGVAVADDLIVPGWRGSEGTTYQQWLFSTSDFPAAPEIVSNPYGSPSASITVGDFGIGWIQSESTYGTRTGLWDLGATGGGVVLGVPNRPVQLSYKDVWVQVTYFAQLTQAPSVAVITGERLGGQTILLEALPEDGGSWYLDQSMWRITPNPDYDIIRVRSDQTNGSLIDQIVIDTICVPEPATLTTLLAGGLALLVSRKRRSIRRA